MYILHIIYLLLLFYRILFDSKNGYLVVYCILKKLLLLEMNVCIIKIILNFVDKQSLDSLIVNKTQFESLLRDLLLVKQYRVEVYTNKGNRGPTAWTLEYKVCLPHKFKPILMSTWYSLLLLSIKSLCI